MGSLFFFFISEWSWKKSWELGNFVRSIDFYRKKRSHLEWGKGQIPTRPWDEAVLAIRAWAELSAGRAEAKEAKLQDAC